MPVNKYNIYIICKDESTFRDKATLLTKQYSSKLCHVQWIPAEYLTLTQCNRKLLKKLKTLYNTKQKKIIAKLGCTAAHRKALLAIYSNQTHNNLILEEDAELSSRLPHPPKRSCYMGGWIIPPKISRAGKQAVNLKPKSGLNPIDYQRFKIITTHALFIQSPEEATTLLDQTIEPEQLKPYDVFLADHQIFTRFYYPPVFIQGSHKSEIDGKGVDINRKRTINYGLQSTTRNKKVTKRRVGKRRLTQRRRVKRRLTKRGGKPLGPLRASQANRSDRRRRLRESEPELSELSRRCAITDLQTVEPLYTIDMKGENRGVCRKMGSLKSEKRKIGPSYGYFLDPGCRVNCNKTNFIYALLIRKPSNDSLATEDPLGGVVFIYVGKTTDMLERLKQHIGVSGSDVGSTVTKGCDILAMKHVGMCPGIASSQEETRAVEDYSRIYPGCVRGGKHLQSIEEAVEVGLKPEEIIQFVGYKQGQHTPDKAQSRMSKKYFLQYSLQYSRQYPRIYINKPQFQLRLRGKHPEQEFGVTSHDGIIYYQYHSGELTFDELPSSIRRD